MPARLRCLCAAVVCAAVSALAGDAGSVERGPTAGARMFWVLPGEPDFLADAWIDLPVARTRFGTLDFSLDHSLTIDKATDDFTFIVPELRYAIDLGWSLRVGGRSLRLLAGQRGLEKIDADGQPYVQFVGAEIASASHDGGSAPLFRWRIAGGPVLEEREVRAEAILRGDASVALRRFGRPASRLAFDVELDSLITGGRVLAEVSAGPRLTLDVAGDRAASLLLYYRRGRNPLGLDKDAVIIGLAYGEGPSAPASGEPPEIDGHLAAGGGEGRWAGRMQLRFLTPEFAGPTRVAFRLDGNILTADDTGEIYYLYDLGLERPVGRSVAGVYFYHRSNHQLAEPNDTITSLNVLEGGVTSPGWSTLVDGSLRGFALDGYARAGYLLSSSFGEERRWHTRGGARLAYGPGDAGWIPYAVVELELGDIRREIYGLGLRLPPAYDLRAEYRSDEQFFGADRTAFVLTAGYAF